MLARVLIATRDRLLRRRLKRIASRNGRLVETVGPDGDLLAEIGRTTSDLVILSAEASSTPLLGLVGLIRELPDAPDVLAVSRHDDSEEDARLMGAGAGAVIRPEVAARTIAEVVEAILERRRQTVERALLTRRIVEHPRLSDFVSSSPAMQAFVGLVRRVVSADSSLLILGETGVGKERLARAIHAEGPRSEAPFVAVNCGGIPETLLESELFGHEEGAFTGASRGRRGVFELAHQGTILLDEIGDIPLHLQVKLLRVLQDRCIQRLGSEGQIPIDVRVVAATNRDLEAEVKEGRFRRDLFYRLSVVTLTVPPLRERNEDIPILVESYIKHFGRRIECNVSKCSEAAMECLTSYEWSGNVRELINVVERAMLLCDGDTISCADLPAALSRAANLSPAARRSDGMPAPEVADTWLDQPLRVVRKRLVADLEKRYLSGLLRKTQGRIGETARRAGITPRALHAQMKRHGLRKEDFRQK
ncbi:sigma 54-interacting transcriptional regulator [Planctomycetota bacterium]